MRCPHFPQKSCAGYPPRNTCPQTLDFLQAKKALHFFGCWCKLSLQAENGLAKTE